MLAGGHLRVGETRNEQVSCPGSLASFIVQAVVPSPPWSEKARCVPALVGAALGENFHDCFTSRLVKGQLWTDLAFGMQHSEIKSPADRQIAFHYGAPGHV